MSEDPPDQQGSLTRQSLEARYQHHNLKMPRARDTSHLQCLQQQQLRRSMGTIWTIYTHTHTHIITAVRKYMKKEEWEQIHTSSPSGALPLVSWSNVTIRICNAVSTKGSTESENRRWLYGTPRPTGSYAHTVFSNDVNIGNACRFSAQVKYWIHRLGATCISVGKETRSYNVKILNKCIFHIL